MRTGIAGPCASAVTRLVLLMVDLEADFGIDSPLIQRLLTNVVVQSTMLPAPDVRRVPQLQMRLSNESAFCAGARGGVYWCDGRRAAAHGATPVGYLLCAPEILHGGGCPVVKQ